MILTNKSKKIRIQGDQALLHPFNHVTDSDTTVESIEKQMLQLGKYFQQLSIWVLKLLKTTIGAVRYQRTLDCYVAVILYGMRLLCVLSQW